jgi:hypothetical protein
LFCTARFISPSSRRWWCSSNPPFEIFAFYGYYLTVGLLLRQFGLRGMLPASPPLRPRVWLALAGSLRAGYLALRHFGLPVITGGMVSAVAGKDSAYRAAWAAFAIWAVDRVGGRNGAREAES